MSNKEKKYMTNTLRLALPITENKEAKQQQLMAQLKNRNFNCLIKTQPDVVEHINQLQLEKAKQQGIFATSPTTVKPINPRVSKF